MNVWTNSVFGATTSNEFRVALSHYGAVTEADNPVSMEIPSIEITELGMIGFNAASSRTAIGLRGQPAAVPVRRHATRYRTTLTLVRGNHLVKAGLDVRHEYVKSFFFPTIRGLLRYTTLNTFVNDIAEATNINKPLPGGTDVVYYRWWDQYYFVQDDWRIGSNLTLNLGLRYELPGNNIQSLIDLNESIVQANNGNPVYALSQTPKADRNNFQPRLGFNWQPTTSQEGLLGMITGGDRLVVRGGYARTNDYAFLNIALNIASSFPFVAAISGNNVPNAFTVLQNTPAGVPAGVNPNTLNRTVVADDFRSPTYDQLSVGIERQLTENLAMRVGYVGTFGNDLFQTLDGNPRQPFAGPTGPRVDPTRGVDPAARQHGRVVVPLDPDRPREALQRRAERRSPLHVEPVHRHRIGGLQSVGRRGRRAAGFVQHRRRQGTLDLRPAAAPHGQFRLGDPVDARPAGRPRRRSLGGWQVSSFFTFQSGAPFTRSNGSDPTGALAGIDGLVGNSIRPESEHRSRPLQDDDRGIREAGGASLFRTLCGMPSPTCAGERVGNAPRNLLRADGIGNIDIGIVKNTRFANGQNMQIRIEMFNATNTRNFGIPDGRITSANFLNQWATDGGSRRIVGRAALCVLAVGSRQ